MRGLRLSIRWWLALAFALIAAVTAFAVATVFSSRASGAFRQRAKELFVGDAFVAAEDMLIQVQTGVPVGRAVANEAGKQDLSMLLVDGRGHVIAAAGDLAGVRVPSAQDARAISRALAGRRFVSEREGGRETVVAMPLRVGHFGALLVAGTQPDLPAELGIVRKQIVEAALLAVLVGAAVGLFVAALISIRLRRIARAAAAVAQGDFDAPLDVGFRDEVGSLAETVNTMRERLQQSFERLAADRDRLHQLLDRLPEGVLVVSPGLELEFANREALRLLPGLRDRAPLPEPWTTFSLRELAARLLEPGAEPAEERLTADDGRAFALIGVPAAASAIVVVADVSERERLERAEREFVANASHELRTPLTTILAAVETLQAGAKEKPEDRDRFIRLIERESARLARLARALLVLARAQTGQEAPRTDPVPLRPLVDEIAEEAPAGVEIRVECEPDAVAVGDATLVEQAVRNLVENAIKYAGSPIGVVVARKGDELSIEVRDSGPGMTAEAASRVFERFQRVGARDPGSFGLGLAIVEQAVRVLGGRVTLDSAPDRGTSVTIVLPAGTPAATAPFGRAA